MTTSNQIAVLTIPAEEWNNLKQQIELLTNKISKIVDKEEKELVTIPEAMKILKVGRATIERYLENGVFESVQLAGKGSKKYISRKQINHALENGMV
ncbi:MULTISPECIES: helix-turn-helix domain-containing protein [unclassified Empedobacter]|uniref:helix-turn-helix domain-containing protein n=1 Tax=unclassified Empedobacter TaxID=2643773 RepID=UPI0025BF4EB3|nr:MULTISPECIES: helix-turn-helix domain-containing protein [unclassified Empedobacter]